MFRFRNHYRGRIITSRDGLLPLTRMGDGQSGNIVQILGGRGVNDRLNALGIRQGQKIKRIGGMYLQGPVTVQVEKTQVAVGFGMASKILIEPEK